jgi:hypothetical protein
MKSKLNIFLWKILLFVLPVLLCFEVLFRLGIYPIMTSSGFFDQKMMEVNKDRIREVKLMAMGSSCTLYDLSSAGMVRNFDLPYYNFSSWGLQISDTRLLLTDLVRQYRPEYVIICSSPWDFMTPPNDTYRNYTSMPPLVRDHFPEVFYFRPFSSIHTLFYRKWESYQPVLDHWGGMPMKIPKKDIHRERWIKNFRFPTSYTEDAYKQLDTLSAWLRDQKVQLIFAEVPLNMVFDNAREAGPLLAAHIEKCRSIVTARGGVYLDYDDPARFPDSLFFDQTHLQAPGAAILTSELAADLKAIIK